MSADAIVKSFIDRILRLKEEQDTLAADIREVYAEAKGNGYDKTALGEVVAYLRKIEKKGRDACEERDAAFGMYLDAYERASHTHAREGRSYTEAKSRESTTPKASIPKASSAETADLGTTPYDPSTGKITAQEQPGEPAHQSQSVHEARSMPAESMGDEISERVGLAGPACAQDAETANTKPAPVSPSTAPAVEPEAAPQAPQSASGEVSDADIPAFIKRDYVLRPHCLNPSLCAGSGSKHCHACLKARDESILADEVAA